MALPLKPTRCDILSGRSIQDVEDLETLTLYDEGLASTADILGLENCRLLIMLRFEF